MGPLANCIKIHGISKEEARLLRKTAMQYRQGGMKAKLANEQAVRDTIDDLSAERDNINRQIKDVLTRRKPEGVEFRQKVQGLIDTGQLTKEELKTIRNEKLLEKIGVVSKEKPERRVDLGKREEVKKWMRLENLSPEDEYTRERLKAVWDNILNKKDISQVVGEMRKPGGKEPKLISVQPKVPEGKIRREGQPVGKLDMQMEMEEIAAEKAQGKLPITKKKTDLSLSQWIRKRGGLKDEGMGGEVRRLERMNLIRKEGESYDYYRELAVDEFNGVTSDTTLSEFIDLVEQDATALARRSEAGRVWGKSKEFDLSSLVKDLNDAIGDKGAIGGEGGADVSKVVPILMDIGKTVYADGHQTYVAFKRQMQVTLGKTYQKVRDLILKVWEMVKRFNEQMGERGSISTKKLIRQITGQVKPSDMVREDEALAAGFKKAVLAAREAYRAGNKEGYAEARAKVMELLEKQELNKQIRKEVTNMIDDMKDVAKKVKKMAPEAANNIESLLADIDLTKLSEQKRIELTPFKDYLENNPETELPKKVMDALIRLDKTPVRDLSLTDLEAMHTAIMHYAHLNKIIQEVRIGNEKMRQAEVLSKALAEMKPIKEVETEAKGSLSRKEFDKIKNRGMVKRIFGIMQDHYDLIVEKLAGPLSTMDKLLYREVKEGILKRLQLRHDLFDAFENDLGKDFTKKHGIKNIPDWLEEKVKTGDFMPLTRGERIALYRHSIHRQNMNHLTEGNDSGFGIKHSENPNQVFKITRDDIDAIVASLTPTEREFASKPVDNLFKKTGDLLAEIFVEKNGYRMPRVEQNYYPIDVMSEALGQDKETAEAIDKFKDTFLRIGLEKGMLEERVESTKPIYLNSIQADLNKAVERATAYIGLEIPLSNASRLLYNPQFRAELKSRYGEAVYKEIEQGLRDIAGQWKTYTDMEQFVMKSKNNVTTAMLGLPNPFPVVAQALSSLPLYMEYVRPAYIMRGMVDIFEDGHEIIERHKLYSPEFRDRMEGATFHYDVSDVFKETAEFRLVGDRVTIKKKLLSGMRFMDSRSVAMGMQGAVLQTLDEFKAGKISDAVKTALDMQDNNIAKLTPEEKIKLAYKYADYATERTQASGLVEHQAPFSKGSVLEKILAMFGADTNTQLNMLRRSYNNAQRTGNWKAFSKTAFLVLVLIPALMTARDELREEIYGRKKQTSTTGKYVKNVAGLVYILRDIVAGAVAVVEKNIYNADFQTPVGVAPDAAIKTLGYGWLAMADESADKRDKAFWEAIDNGLFLVSLRYGIPYQSPKQIGKVITGQTDNQPKGRQRR